MTEANSLRTISINEKESRRQSASDTAIIQGEEVAALGKESINKWWAKLELVLVEH